ncbi:pitrilysin family protein [Marinilabilia sp.]|uniref:M16 family metallopeptidase n=1 Tax=Marinilabilia sp. TaxID=2021252 RepID=UPI0025C1C673|nr:pitrilysin family protein [Marinilabilia sp.]
MKRIFSITILLALVTAVSGQLDRSTPPEPGPAPEVKIGDYEKFTLSNGLTVIVVENNKVPAVSYSLSLDVTLPAEGELAGYIDIAGGMLRSGTVNRSKAEIDEAVDFIGATLSTQSKEIYARSLSKHSEPLLEIMSDVLLNPSFPQEELDKQITQYKTAIQANKEEPSAIAQNVAGRLVYGKTDPYGEIMSEETLGNISTENLIDYYNSYYRPNTAYLVIVGDITVKEAKKQAKKYFGAWEEAPVPKNIFPYPAGFNEPKVAISNKDGANQSTIVVTHDVNLTPGHPDSPKARVMNGILGGGSFNARLFQNLREDKAYTYGAYSNLESDERVGTFTARAQVRTSVTDSALTEILKEMELMRTELVSDEELQLVKNAIIGNFGRSLEDPQTVARFALNIERYDLPRNYYENYLKKIEEVTKEDVRDAAIKYLKPHNAVVLAVGNASEIAGKMKSFSPSQTVTQYDYYGKVVEKKAVGEDVSATEVLAKYIEAIGGKNKVTAVSDLAISMAMSLQGMDINIEILQKNPGKFYQATSMNGNVVSMQVLNGDQGKMKTPMGEQNLEGETLKQLQESARIFPELNYLQEGVEIKLDGLETVNGKETYKMIVSKPSGTSTTIFFGVKDGLKYKEVSETPQGIVSTTYDNYSKIDGILFPMVLKQVLGPQSFDIEVTEVAVNKGIDDSKFEIN